MNEELPVVNEKKSLMYVLAGVIIIIVIFLIIFFIAKYFNPYKYEQVTYNYFTFVKKGTHWMTEWQGNNNLYELGFRFNPFEAESVPVVGSLSEEFNNRDKIYVTFDPFISEQKYTALGGAELLLILKKVLNKKVEMACIKQDNIACVNRPIVNCNSNASVIFLKPEPPTKILLNNSCIILQGEKFELVKSIDRLLYQWLKIIR